MSPKPIWHRPAYPLAVKKGLSVTELGARQKTAADEIRDLWAFLDKRAGQLKPAREH
jgi:hypothetical protein